MHNLIKNLVDAVYYLRPATEVFMQVDFLLAAFLTRIRLVLFHKQFRPCQTEAVDALLDVSDHKQVMPAQSLARNRL